VLKAGGLVRDVRPQFGSKKDMFTNCGTLAGRCRRRIMDDNHRQVRTEVDDVGMSRTKLSL